jgi:glycosyltransferase involved in cell wall biosynthesis
VKESTNFPKIELLIVCDFDSNSEPARQIESFFSQEKVRYVYSNSRNPNGSRSLGLSEASGDWIIFIDSDDFLDFGILSEVVNFNLNERCAYVFGFEMIDTRTGFRRTLYSPSTNNILRMPGIWRFLIARSAFQPSFFYEGNMGEDLLLLSAVLMCLNSVHKINKTIYFYQRYSQGQLTTDKVLWIEYEKTLKGFFDFFGKCGLSPNQSTNLAMGIFTSFLFSCWKVGKSKFIMRMIKEFDNISLKKTLVLIFVLKSLPRVIFTKLTRGVIK